MSVAIEPPLKWHGGKHYLAKKLIEKMPPHVHYVEPFAGGLSVLLAKNPEGVSEAVNDINGELTNFWQVLQSPVHFAEFHRRLQCTPFSEHEYKRIVSPLHDTLDTYKAAEFFIKCRQSLAGRMDTFAPLSRNRVRRKMNEQASAWLSAVEGLPLVHSRLIRVVILNQPALDVIQKQDSKNSFFYCDPPYLHETRTTTGEYEFEMTKADHALLLQTLAGVEGKFMLSGYRSDMYDTFAGDHNWYRVDFDVPNNASGGARKRRMTESVWTNYRLDKVIKQ